MSKTALIDALKKCDLAKVRTILAFKLLLQYGGNPDVRGKDGRTVREIASRKRDRRYFNALA